MVRMDESRIILERQDEGYDKAWTALIDAGYKPEDFMYMYSEEKTGKAFFKHRMMRNYVSVGA